MISGARDDERVHVYFASLDRHVERWRREGGRWEPYEGEVPIAAMQAAALSHPSAKVRRHALGVLDHAANDASTATFRAALADPVAKVRLVALHGLSCERCRIGEVCVEDVVSDVMRTLRADTNPTVRHAAIDVLARFITRDERVVPALRRVAEVDTDELVRLAAARAATGERKVWTRKAVRRRHRTAVQRAAGGAPQRLQARSERRAGQEAGPRPRSPGPVDTSAPLVASSGLDDGAAEPELSVGQRRALGRIQLTGVVALALLTVIGGLFRTWQTVAVVLIATAFIVLVLGWIAATVQRQPFRDLVRDANRAVIDDLRQGRTEGSHRIGHRDWRRR